MSSGHEGVRHLYIHLPYCVHRCGYCDFVTAVGRPDEHDAYASAILTELERERHVLAEEVETVFVGGGTPTFTEPAALARVLAALPRAEEVTVEANPETITPALALLLRGAGANRISLGAQTFHVHLLEALERRTTPAQVRGAFAILRDAGFDNLSLDLIYGIPGQTPADLDADLEAALALEPEHISAYELEAKPGTRFTHAWADALASQAEAMEAYPELVVDRLCGAGFRWYETANFSRGGGRDLRARHNLGYWRGADYLGIGVGAVSTLGRERRRNRPSVARYLEAARRDEPPARELEPLDEETKTYERVMLGLRLDEPLPLTGLEETIDESALEQLVARGLVLRSGSTITLAPAARLLGGAITAALLRDRATPSAAR
jgi:oxygen-independent coproporphyrinogen-3 oxidase